MSIEEVKEIGQENKWTKRLRELKEKVESLNASEVPLDIARQNEYLAEQLQIIGRFLSSAVHRQKWIYANRKHAEDTLKKTEKGPEKIKDLRLQEAAAIAEVKRWEYAYESTKELIQAKKYTLNILHDEMHGKSGGSYGK
jgi:hypothetical protein